jgi:hypothetical protein
MTGSVRDIKSHLAEAVVAAKKAKAAIRFITQQGRLLMAEADFHQIQEQVLILGNDAGTMDTFLAEWHRMGVSGKSFVAAREVERVESGNY